MTSSARSRRRLELTTAGLDLDRLALPALAVALLVSGLLIYHLTRGSSFSVDDWTWIDSRRTNSVDTFLAPYNGHLSLIPIAIYRLMFALFGIGDFAPYRVLLFVVASMTGLAIFEYARHRIGAFGAAIVATLLLFVGPGWNDIMQPFQIAWLIAVTTGLLALTLLDRRRPAADIAACLLIGASLASTSVGVALAVGIAVDIALRRRTWRDAWIVGVPLLLYGVWAIHYHPTGIQLSSLWSAPLNLAQVSASAVAGVLGLSGVTSSDLTGVAVTFGIALLALAWAAAIARTRMGWDATRFCALATALLVFSLLTTLARSFQSPFESRYLYVICVLVTLMGVELARGISVPLRAWAGLAALTLVAVVSNVSVLQSGGSYFRRLGELADATLGAVQLDRGAAASTTLVRLYPLGSISVGRYLAAERALGTPAFTLAQLQRASPGAQAAADAQMMADRDVTVTGLSTPVPPGGAAPGLEGAVGATATRRGPCVDYAPASTLAPDVKSTLTLRLAPGRVSVRAVGAPATLSVRRFSPTYATVGRVGSGAAAAVAIIANQASEPWHLQVQSSGSVRICTVSPT
jgi:hypothetical protein